MNAIRYALSGAFVVVLVFVALANAEVVTLALWPKALAPLLGESPSLRMPLFVVIAGALCFGLGLGLIWEWLRERPYRVETAALRRELEASRRKLEAPTPQAAQHEQDTHARARSTALPPAKPRLRAG